MDSHHSQKRKEDSYRWKINQLKSWTTFILFFFFFLENLGLDWYYCLNNSFRYNSTHISTTLFHLHLFPQHLNNNTRNFLTNEPLISNKTFFFFLFHLHVFSQHLNNIIRIFFIKQALNIKQKFLLLLFVY